MGFGSWPISMRRARLGQMVDTSEGRRATKRESARERSAIAAYNRPIKALRAAADGPAMGGEEKASTASLDTNCNSVCLRK